MSARELTSGKQSLPQALQTIHFQMFLVEGTQGPPPAHQLSVETSNLLTRCALCAAGMWWSSAEAKANAGLTCQGLRRKDFAVCAICL